MLRAAVAALLLTLLGTAAIRGRRAAVRLHGSVEPVRSHPVVVPRLTGSSTGSLVIVHLVKPGTVVKRGDLLIEFDRQAQLKTAHDREAEYRDFVEQINKKRGEQITARAHDEAEIKTAENAVKTAELEMLKNEMSPPIVAEQNTLTLAESQSEAAAAPQDVRSQTQGRRCRRARARDPARPREERLDARREQRGQDARRVADRRHGRAEDHLEERHDGRSAGRRGSALGPSDPRRRRRFGDARARARQSGGRRRTCRSVERPASRSIRIPRRRSAAASNSCRRSARSARCRTASGRSWRSSASRAATRT